MCNNYFKAIAVSAVLGVCGVSEALAAFDQNVTPDVIFGSGNLNGGFTTDQASGVELGLRGKLRHNALGAPANTFNSNGDGTYSFAAGVAPTQASPTAIWSFEWSINSNFDGTGGNLNAYTYGLSIDTDPSQGVGSLALLGPLTNPFDPINVAYADHSIGTNATLNDAGTEATTALEYASLIANNNVAQNSWKPHWFIPGFDPTLDATYDITLAAFDNAGQVASTTIQIIVGAGGAAVPEGGATVLLLGASILGMSGFRRFLKKA